MHAHQQKVGVSVAIPHLSRGREEVNMGGYPPFHQIIWNILQETLILQEIISHIMSTTVSVKPSASSRLTIRTSAHSLSFSSLTFDEGKMLITHEPYQLKSGISVAANLREAFKTSELTTADYQRVMVMVDSDVLLEPISLFSEDEVALHYRYTLPDTEGGRVLHTIIPDLKTVAAYMINKDLYTVITDRYPSAQFMNVLCPIWRYLYQRNFATIFNKLYAYFHDDKVDIFCFSQNRFKFANAFSLTHSGSLHACCNDAIYFILNVWQQLALKTELDELHLMGEVPEREWMVSELRRYLQKVYVINPSGEFNRAPATQVEGLPFDMMTYFIKGR